MQAAARQMDSRNVMLATSPVQTVCRYNDRRKFPHGDNR
jgi:hypothetical protein